MKKKIIIDANGTMRLFLFLIFILPHSAASSSFSVSSFVFWEPKLNVFREGLYRRSEKRIRWWKMKHKPSKVEDNKPSGVPERAKRNLMNKSIVIPLMYLLVKDHKEMPDDKPIKSRPVVGGHRAQNTPLSDLVAMILEPTADLIGGVEIRSTNELLDMIDQRNDDGWSKPDTDSLDTEYESTSTITIETGFKPTMTRSTGLDRASLMQNLKKNINAAKSVKLDKGAMVPLDTTELGSQDASALDSPHVPGGSLVCIGSDVEALYPSLDAETFSPFKCLYKYCMS